MGGQIEHQGIAVAARRFGDAIGKRLETRFVLPFPRGIMEFDVGGLPQGINAGGSVEFEFRQGKDGLFEIASIAPAQTSNVAPTDTAAKGVITKPRDNATPGAKP